MSHELTSALAAAAARRDVTTFRPVLLDAGAPDTPAALAALAADPGVVVVDELGEQLEQLVQGRAPRERLAGAACRAAVRARAGRPRAGRASATWVFYPWSRRLVHVLPAPLHRELRLDRNRYAITVGGAASGWPGCAWPWPACRSGARWCRRWRTRASAASCGWPTSTCWTSRTSTGSRAASPTSA